MRYLLILSVLVLAAPAVMLGSFSGLFSAYACGGCTEEEEEEAIDEVCLQPEPALFFSRDPDRFKNWDTFVWVETCRRRF